MPLFRRSNVYRPENEKDENSENRSSPEQIGEVASEDIPTLSEGEITYSKLVTAYGNSETPTSSARATGKAGRE